MARLDKLWRDVDGPGLPPRLDRRRVKARVNAALDADQAERKIYMKQKLRTALIAAAAAAALTGSAFAATANWNGLSAWFKGDSAPVQEYVDSTVRSVSDDNYTLTVEGMVTDGNSAYFTVSITALSDEAREFLWSDRFIDMDTLCGGPVFDADATAKNSGKDMPAAFSGPGYREIECQAEDTRRFAVDMNGFPASTTAVRIRCGYMEQGKQIELPLAPAPSKTVQIGASGKGILSLGIDTLPEPEVITIDEIAFSPLTIRIRGSLSYGTEPSIRLRMADGSIRTQSQMMEGVSWNESEAYYRFKEVQDLDSIASFIVFDKEYPLDGSEPTPVEHDSSLDPITVARMEPLNDRGGYAVPVRELTEKLGGTCAWDPATGDVTCVYRGVSVVLHAGRNTALVDGESVELLSAPAEQDGVLAADWKVLSDAWELDGFVQRDSTWDPETNQSETEWHDWYIIP